MKEYYNNGRGLKVTANTLTTRYRDEQLAPIQSVLVGRETLWVSLVTGLGLMLFARQFHDLLFWHEHALLFGAGAVILAAGYSIANLKVGQYLHEKTVFWSTIWTVNKVRHALAEARQPSPANHSAIIIDEDNGE